MIRKKLGEFALEENFLTEKELQMLLSLQEEKRRNGWSLEDTRIGKLLVSNYYCTEIQIQKFLKQQSFALETATQLNSLEKEETDPFQTLKSLKKPIETNEFAKTKLADITPEDPSNRTKEKDILTESLEKKEKEFASEKISVSQSHRYTLLKELGEGGMGVVQLVKDELLGREVALKRIHVQSHHLIKKGNQLLWRLKREAEFMAILEHPNIVPLYEMQVKEAGEIQFTMKKVEGQTFRNLLKAEGKAFVSERKLLEILLKVCDGVRYAHSKGIVHRDLKPDNIMVGNYGEVYILDWGIAKKLGESVTDIDTLGQNVTDFYRTIGGLGTEGYMPPEQKKMALSATERSDIYSLGKILRECFIRLSPWEELKLLQSSLKKDLKNSEILNLKENFEKKIPKEIQAIIKKATAKNPTERYPEVQKFSEDIESYLKYLPVSVQEYRLDELLQKWAKRHWKMLTILGSIFFLGMTLWGLWKWDQESHYQHMITEAQEKRTQGESIQERGRSEREQKVKLFLQSLNAINQALTYKPRTRSLELSKIQIVEQILPYCYQEEDYQLATFVVENLQAITHFPEKKQALFHQVEQQKTALLKQHLGALEDWKRQYMEKKLIGKEREDFVRELSKMREEEIFQILVNYFNQASELFLKNKKVSLHEKSFYEDVVRVLGELENDKVGAILRENLTQLYRQFKRSEFFATPSHLHALHEEKFSEFLKALSPETKLPPNLFQDHYTLRKQNLYQWNVFDAQEPLFKIIFFPETKIFRVYEFKKLNNLDYSRFIKMIIISLCEIRDALSIPLIFEIKHDPKLIDYFLGDDIGYELQKLLKNRMFPPPQNIKECLYQALVYSYQEDFDRTIEIYTQAIAFDPQSYAAYMNRGLNKVKKKDFEGALKDYDEAIRLNSDFSDAYRNRGILKEKKQDWPGAFADYTEAIRLNPHSSETFALRGTAYGRIKKWDEAIADYTEAIRLNPESVEVYVNRGFTKQLKQDPDGALEDYAEAIRLNPQYASAYYYRGITYAQKKQWNDAITNYNEAIRLNPEYAQAYTNRGFAKEELEDSEGALEDYTEAIRLNPKLQEPYINRGAIHRRKRNWTGVIEDWEQTLKIQMIPAIQKELLEILKQQSRYHTNQKQWKEAQKLLIKMKQHLPESDPQQKQLDQKVQELENRFLSEEKK